MLYISFKKDVQYGIKWQKNPSALIAYLYGRANGLVKKIPTAEEEGFKKTQKLNAIMAESGGG